MRKLFLIALILSAFSIVQADDFGWDSNLTFSDYANMENVGNLGAGIASTYGLHWLLKEKFGVPDNWAKFGSFAGSNMGNYGYNARYQRFHEEEGASLPATITWTLASGFTEFVLLNKNPNQPGASLKPIKNGLAVVIKF